MSTLSRRDEDQARLTQSYLADRSRRDRLSHRTPAKSRCPWGIGHTQFETVKDFRLPDTFFVNWQDKQCVPISVYISPMVAQAAHRESLCETRHEMRARRLC